MACLAVLMGAVAPTITHALGDLAGAGWVEVCSTLGVRLIKVGAPADPSLPTPDHNQASDCPYCSLHAASAAPSPVTVVAVASLLFLFEVPRLFLAAPGSRFAWAAPQSRAPPEFS
jgi:hypothetical protein